MFRKSQEVWGHFHAPTVSNLEKKTFMGLHPSPDLIGLTSKPFQKSFQSCLQLHETLVQISSTSFQKKIHVFSNIKNP